MLELAEAVGPTGSVVGVDISAPMLERAQARARELGLSERVCFRQADAQVADLGAGAFDAVHSRFGIMFFDDPIAAFRNLRGALRTGGLVAFVCWRCVERNPWFTVTARAASAYLAFPEELPPKTPGPFGFAERSWIESVLGGVGFAELEIVSSDAPMELAADLDDLVDLQLSIGPVSRALRDAAVSPKTRTQVERAVRDALGAFLTPSGHEAPASAWLVRAMRPR